MPGLLAPVTLDISKAERELADTKTGWTATLNLANPQAVAFLRERPNLCLLNNPRTRKGYPSVYKHEVTLQGAFRADLVHRIHQRETLRAGGVRRRHKGQYLQSTPRQTAR